MLSNSLSLISTCANPCSTSPRLLRPSNPLLWRQQRRTSDLFIVLDRDCLAKASEFRLANNQGKGIDGGSTTYLRQRPRNRALVSTTLPLVRQCQPYRSGIARFSLTMTWARPEPKSPERYFSSASSSVYVARTIAIGIANRSGCLSCKWHVKSLGSVADAGRFNR